MSQRSFLLNQWYVAGRSAEMSRAPLARRICDQPLVFFRRADGSLAVLEDRCPHRNYALSKGTIVGDDIQCGYHGIRFDGSGRCTQIPTQPAIPRGFAARSFPVVERSALVYVWIGDPARADLGSLPDFFENVAAGWTAVHGYHHVQANYQLVIDNLLDLTHIAFVHLTTLAGPGIKENPLTVTVEGDVVHARREMRGVDPAPFFRIMRDFPGKIDRFQNIRFMVPNHVYIRAEACPTGISDDPDMIHNVVMNHLTPETERTTHYFWSVSRRMRLDDAEVSRLVYEMNRAAFDEDAEILKCQQERMETDPSGGAFANLAADEAAQAARRIIRRKLGEDGVIERAS